MTNEEKVIKARTAWLGRKPGRLIGRGHPVGDFLEAHKWKLLEEDKGHLRVEAHLPRRVRNLREQLFGGFTPTYVDFLSLFTVRAASDRAKPWGFWLATTSLRVDYFEPVTGPRFVIESRLTKERGRTLFVETRFFDQAGHMTVFAVASMRKLPVA